MHRSRFVLLCLLSGAVTACGSSGGGGSGLPVVATTTQLADFVRAVAGPDADVHQILRPNTDPHEYEPRPSDVRAVAGAKVVVESGNRLDRWMGKVISEAGGSPRVLVAAPDHIPVRRGTDPHWWHDPRNAEAVVRWIATELSAADPAHRAAYARRAAAYVAALRRLDAGIARCFDRIPRARRLLVTDHDAFGYFAARYEIRIVGAVIPSQSTQAQASARGVARLAALIRREHVRAVFPESSVSPKLAQAIARQTGASSDLVLYGDTLGPTGSRGATYLGMEAANADAMARGFTGGRSGCAPSRRP